MNIIICRYTDEHIVPGWIMERCEKILIKSKDNPLVMVDGVTYCCVDIHHLRGYAPQYIIYACEPCDDEEKAFCLYVQRHAKFIIHWLEEN